MGMGGPPEGPGDLSEDTPEIKPDSLVKFKPGAITGMLTGMFKHDTAYRVIHIQQNPDSPGNDFYWVGPKDGMSEKEKLDFRAENADNPSETVRTRRQAIISAMAKYRRQGLWTFRKDQLKLLDS